MSNKKVLITGGHTQIPIDQVRVISNIFKGNTACNIANYFGDDNRKCEVTVLGNPEMEKLISKKVRYESYKSYDELYSLMKYEISCHNYDIIIHSAAVSDYYVAGVVTEPGGKPIDSSKKISSSNESLFLELKKTRKIVDDIRTLWEFKGKLVKFKLQVGMTDEELLTIARKSGTESQANIMIANCLEWSKERAYILTWRDDKTLGTVRGEYSVSRENLPEMLYKEIMT